MSRSGSSSGTAAATVCTGGCSTSGRARAGSTGACSHDRGAAKRPLPEVTEQLDAYFAGERREFDIPLDLQGAVLELEVWRRLLEIPYGETTSYGELAARIDPALFPAEVEPWERARIVGATNGRNPVSIVVPCHRVIGADGSLTGYGGSLQRKQALDPRREAGVGEAGGFAVLWERSCISAPRKFSDGLER